MFFALSICTSQLVLLCHTMRLPLQEQGGILKGNKVWIFCREVIAIAKVALKILHTNEAQDPAFYFTPDRRTVGRSSAGSLSGWNIYQGAS